jgi:DNA-binding transcriptional LysR family regulator
MAVTLDLNQLKAFFILSQTLSFTKAAWRLHVSQSAVSHAIKKLESHAGLALISRRGRHFALTEEGQALARSCQLVFGELERIEDSLSSRGRRVQTIRLGATVEFGTLVLIRNMPPFLARNPGIHVDFRFTNDPLPGLMSDELDIIIDCKKHVLPGLERTALFREQYVVVASPAFLKGKRLEAPQDLEGETVISLDQKAHWWGRFLQAVPPGERPAFKRESIIEINHVRGIINAATEAIGIALLPKYSIVMELRRRKLVNLFPAISVREDEFSIYQKKKKSSVDAHKKFVAYMTQLHPEEFG